jgi:solute carrier family 13 (sodium-dependent dicarboxylate transporter), member 2/3/5
MTNDPMDKPLKIDRRPLWQIIANQTIRYQALAVLVATAIILFQLTPPEGLTAKGFQALILFSASIILWISGLLPVPVTALLAMAMLPLTGIMPAKQTYALFGNEAVFFILGAFILAAAITGTGLSARLARAMLVRFGRTPQRLALTIFLLATVLSFIMNEHAVAAMLFPVVSEIVNSLGLKAGKSSYAKLLFMSIAWGCVIGGIATFLGGARAPLAVGILRESQGIDISFMQWTMASMMIVIPLLLIGYILLLTFFRPDLTNVEPGIAFLNRKRLETGKISYDEIFTATIMVATISGWMFFGHKIGLATIAILGTALMFVFRVVTWERIEEYVNWGIILMYGGSIALASALEKTGAALWLVNKGLNAFEPSPMVIIAIISLISIILTECISHAAVVAILMPIGLTIAVKVGVDPRVMTLAIALPAGLAYCLPMGTPATAIVYGSGYLKTRDIVVPGAVMVGISWVLFLISAYLIWPLIGF